MSIRSTLLVAAAALSLAPAAAQGQADSRGRLYRLTPASDIVEGCFAPCLCPISIEQDLRGRFVLIRTGVDPLYTQYSVSDVRLTAPQYNRTYIGSGTYRIGGEVAVMDQMILDLSLNGAAPVHFESELTSKVGRWPVIDVSVSRNHLYCHDTLLHIVARPVADWDGNGVVGVQDLFAFLGDYFAGAADVDDNPEPTVGDIFMFLDAYFTGL
jgi:hypothetical protein